MENLMIENLKAGEILLVAAKRVNGGKVQLEFAQIVKSPNSSNNILGMLNEGDDRFSQSGKPRRAWLSAEPTAVQKYFGVDVSDLKEVGQERELNILNPTLNGQSLNLQINETTEGSAYDVANFETRAKRKGKDGDFITHGGKYIYVNLSVVTGEAKHRLLEADTIETAPQKIDLGV